MRRAWNGEVRGAGWSLRDTGRRKVTIGVSLVVGDTPAAHCGRRVEVELTPEYARWLAKALTDAAAAVEAAERQRSAPGPNEVASC